MSKLAENARMALLALLTNKLRALLTTIGIGIGIAAVIVLVSLGDAVQGYVTRQFMGVGSDLVYVRSAPPAGGGGQRAGRTGAMLSSLTGKDVSLLEDSANVPNVKAVVPVIQIMGTTSYGDKTDRRASITGTTASYFGVLGRQLGRKGSALPGTLEALHSRGRPGDHIAPGIGNGYQGIVEGGLDVGHTHGNILPFLFLFRACRCPGHHPSLSLLPFAHHAAARAFAGTGVGMGTLAPDRQAAPVPETPVAPQIHQALDIHGYFPPEIPFHL